jgi:peptidoglycan/xylan/chitin deacetylase (PgdA/CDA1 family)
MKARTHLRTAIIPLDGLIADICLAIMGERGALLSFVFHGLFLNDDELNAGVIAPQQGITVEMFRKFISHFKSHGYRFVSPKEIMEGLQPGESCVLITFDDGYYNNIRARPVLEEFDVPAVFFISSDHVKYGKAYWWDVVFREFGRRGKGHEALHRAMAHYKRLKTATVESLLTAEFGEHSLRPVSDLDRPFSESELRDFATHRLVFLGNHTKEHAILTNYSVAEIREQIQGGQAEILEMTGKSPLVIAYPNGSYSAEAVHIAREAGLQLGMVIQPGKNRLPLKPAAKESMILRRFILWGDRGIEAQCRIARSELSIYRMLSSLKAKAHLGLSLPWPA